MSPTHSGLTSSTHSLKMAWRLIVVLLSLSCYVSKGETIECVENATYYINRSGMDITLNAIHESNITNILHSEWSDPDDMAVSNSTRIKIPKLGQLVILNVSRDDVGTWAFDVATNFTILHRTTCNVTLALPDEQLTIINSLSNARNINGNIEITWALTHLAGLYNSEISFRAFCSLARNRASNPATESGSGNKMDTMELQVSCMGTDLTCFNYTDLYYNGSVKLGPVQAGENYTCALIADALDEDVKGADIIFSVIPLTGIPSIPSISAEYSSDMVTLTLASKYAGILSSDNSFKFRVIVDGVHNKTYNFSDYTDNKIETIMIPLPIRDNYEVQVSAINQYGESQYASYGPFNITQASTTGPTSTAMSNIAGIAVGVVVGVLVAAVIAVAVIIIVVFVVMRNKRKKGSMKITPKDESKSKPV